MNFQPEPEHVWGCQEENRRKKLAWALHPNICVINYQLAPSQTEEVNTVRAHVRASITTLGCKEELGPFTELFQGRCHFCDQPCLTVSNRGEKL